MRNSIKLTFYFFTSWMTTIISLFTHFHVLSFWEIQNWISCHLSWNKTGLTTETQLTCLAYKLKTDAINSFNSLKIIQKVNSLWTHIRNIICWREVGGHVTAEWNKLGELFHEFDEEVCAEPMGLRQTGPRLTCGHFSQSGHEAKVGIAYLAQHAY